MGSTNLLVPVTVRLVLVDVFQTVPVPVTRIAPLDEKFMLRTVELLLVNDNAVSLKLFKLRACNN